jgi:hypothetical protein
VRIDGRIFPGAWVRRSTSALVKVFSLAPGRSLHREQVLGRLWPGLAPEAARPRLRTATHYARRALGHRSAVVLHGDVLSLLPDAEVEVDVALFRRLAQMALRSRTATDVDAAIASTPENCFPRTCSSRTPSPSGTACGGCTWPCRLEDLLVSADPLARGERRAQAVRQHGLFVPKRAIPAAGFVRCRLAGATGRAGVGDRREPRKGGQSTEMVTWSPHLRALLAVSRLG